MTRLFQLLFSASIVASVIFAQDRPIVLKAATVLDGKGKTLHNTILVIEGSKIARIGGAIPAGAVVYDLSQFTVTPGWIDTHAHIGYHFDNSGRNSGRGEPPAQAD
jgi:imidazolonepropionase-like amidohydrolase